VSREAVEGMTPSSNHRYQKQNMPEAIGWEGCMDVVVGHRSNDRPMMGGKISLSHVDKGYIDV